MHHGHIRAHVAHSVVMRPAASACFCLKEGAAMQAVSKMCKVPVAAEQLRLQFHWDAKHLLWPWADMPRCTYCRRCQPPSRATS